MAGGRSPLRKGETVNRDQGDRRDEGGKAMSGYDIFAWIVLIILIASAIGVFCIAGWLPGHIAKSRNHPYAHAVTVAGWITLFFGFALWPVAFIWAYVDVPRRRSGDA
jgi:hypothetical protein